VKWTSSGTKQKKDSTSHFCITAKEVWNIADNDFYHEAQTASILFIYLGIIRLWHVLLLIACNKVKFFTAKML